MILTQFIFVAIGFIMLMVIFIQYKRDILKSSQVLVWAMVWVLLIISSLFIGFFSSLIKISGIARPVDFFIYLSIIFMFILIYRLSIKQEIINRNITSLVRNQAIMETIPKHLLKNTKLKKYERR